MSDPAPKPAWTPPSRSYYLRLFGLCLAVLVLVLVWVLFALGMEAVSQAQGILQARQQETVRAQSTGVVDMGWHEGKAVTFDGTLLQVRLDRFGKGISDPADGSVYLIENHQGKAALFIDPDKLAKHSLAVGDLLWPGQPLVVVVPDAAKGKKAPVRQEAPRQGKAWLVTKVHKQPGEAVQPGDKIVTLVPADPATREPIDIVALLEVREERAGPVQPGQPVRLYSAMYPHRLYGHAKGIIETVEPVAEPDEKGRSQVRARARVVAAPFPLKLGSHVQGEIVVGRKPIYRIILEH